MLEKINDKARGSCEIEEIRVGQTKECMDAVGDSNLLVIDITGVFGGISSTISSVVAPQQTSHVSMHFRLCCQHKQH